MDFDFREIIDIVENAGNAIMKLYNKEFKTEIKEDNSPVTEADMLAHKILTEKLSKYGYEIISEEGENLIPKENSFWVIDPIDGTKDFISKTGEFSVMLGFLENGVTTFSVICAPAMGKTYYAIKDKGSFLIENGTEKKLSINVGDKRMVISRNHFKAHEKETADNIGVKDYVKMGSTGVKFGCIAEGKADFYLNDTKTLGIWDVCGPSLIVKEAGAFVFDKFGNELTFDLESKKMKKGVIVTTSLELKEEVVSYFN